MSYSSKEINKLIDYLEKRQISPSDAINIIHASTPEGQGSNRKFNWKMLRFTLYVWQRLEEEKGRNLNSKTESARLVVSSKNYKQLYEGYHTDPRQKHLFKPRYFVYPKTKKTIPQDHIDHLMQWPKNTL